MKNYLIKTKRFLRILYVIPITYAMMMSGIALINLFLVVGVISYFLVY